MYHIFESSLTMLLVGDIEGVVREEPLLFRLHAQHVHHQECFFLI
jgi:hypothetical protein